MDDETPSSSGCEQDWHAAKPKAHVLETHNTRIASCRHTQAASSVVLNRRRSLEPQQVEDDVDEASDSARRPVYKTSILSWARLRRLKLEPTLYGIDVKNRPSYWDIVTVIHWAMATTFFHSSPKREHHRSDRLLQ